MPPHGLDASVLVASAAVSRFEALAYVLVWIPDIDPIWVRWSAFDGGLQADRDEGDGRTGATAAVAPAARGHAPAPRVPGGAPFVADGSSNPAISRNPPARVASQPRASA